MRLNPGCGSGDRCEAQDNTCTFMCYNLQIINTSGVLIEVITHMQHKMLKIDSKYFCVLIILRK